MISAGKILTLKLFVHQTYLVSGVGDVDKLLLVDHIKSLCCQKVAWGHASLHTKSSNGLLPDQSTWTDHQQICKGSRGHWSECCSICKYVSWPSITASFYFHLDRNCEHNVFMGHNATFGFVLYGLPILSGMSKLMSLFFMSFIFMGVKSCFVLHKLRKFYLVQGKFKFIGYRK